MEKKSVILGLIFSIIILGSVLIGSATITNPVENELFFNNSNITLKWDLDNEKNYTGCSYILDSENSTLIPSCYDNQTILDSLNEGEHKVTLKLNDDNGYEEINRTFYVDTISPKINITSFQNGSQHDHVISEIEFELNETNPEYCWYSNGSQTSTPENDSTLSGINSTEDWNTWTIYCNDSAGNLNSTNVSFWVDSIYPNITILNPLFPLDYTKENSFEVTSEIFEKNLDEFEAGKESRIEVWDPLNNNFPSFPTAAVNRIVNSSNISFYEHPLPDEGKYTYISWAKDTRNHISNKTGTIIRDTINPIINISNPINNHNYSDIVEISVFSEDNKTITTDVSNIKNITLQITNGTWSYSNSSNSSSINYSWNSSEVADGYYNITATTFDKAGNQDNETIEINIDNTAPKINFNWPNDGGIYNSNQTINITAEDEAGHLNKIYLYYSNGTLINNSNTSPLLHNLSDGNYTVYGYANDTLGNWNKTDNVTFLIDTIDPYVGITSIIDNPSEYILENVTINGFVNDTNFDMGQLNITNSSGHLIQNWTIPDASQGSPDLSNLSVGNYTATLWAIDLANNTNITSVNFTVEDTTAPIFNKSISYRNVTYGTDWAGYDFDAFDYSPLGTWTINNSNFTINQTGYLDAGILSAGNYSVNISVKDTYGNSNYTLFTLEVKKATPVLNLSVINATYPANGTINASATNYNDGSLNYSLYIDGNYQSSGDSINLSKQLSAGNHTITYNTTGGLNYTSNSITKTLEIEKANSSIKLEINGSEDNYTAETPDYNVLINGTIIDGGNEDISIYKNGGFLLNNTGTINLTSFGLYNITALYTGNENYSSSYKTFWINATDTTNPLIDFATNTEGNGTSVSQNWIFVNISVTEVNEDVISFNLYNSSGLLNSSSYSNGKRTINWTSLNDGIYSYNVSINDTAGNSNQTETRTITLDTTAPIINISSPENTTYTTNFTWFNATANENVDTWIVNYNGTNIFDINFSRNLEDGDHNVSIWANDSLGNSGYEEIQFSIDTTDPNITSEDETNKDHNSIKINWNTDEPANSTIYYGTNESDLNKTESNPNNIASHSITLSDLSASTTYYYNISSCDGVGHCTTEGIYNFTTDNTPTNNPPSGGGGGSTTKYYNCANWSDWSTCENGTQTRECLEREETTSSEGVRLSEFEETETRDCVVQETEDSSSTTMNETESGNTTEESSEEEVSETQEQETTGPGITGAVTGFAGTTSGKVILITIGALGLAWLGTHLYRRRFPKKKKNKK